MATPTYELIETTTLSSSASSVTFSSITQDYRDLVLVINLPSSDPGTIVNVQPNGNTGNLSGVLMRGISGSGTNSTTFSNPGWNVIQVASAASGGLGILQIMDYSATDKHKTGLVRKNYDAEVWASVQRWDSTAAITSLTINGSNDLQADTSLSLYGIAS